MLTGLLERNLSTRQMGVFVPQSLLMLLCFLYLCCVSVCYGQVCCATLCSPAHNYPSYLTLSFLIPLFIALIRCYGQS